MERCGQIREDFGGRGFGVWIWEGEKRKMKADFKAEWQSMQRDIYSQVSKWQETGGSYVSQGFTGNVPVKGINLGNDFKLGWKFLGENGDRAERFRERWTRGPQRGFRRSPQRGQCHEEMVSFADALQMHWTEEREQRIKDIEGWIIIAKWWTHLGLGVR